MTNKTKAKPKRTKVHNDRLLKLADFLARKVKDDQFDLHTIGDYDHVDVDPTIENGYEVNKTVNCLSVACAIGWSPACFPKDLYGYDGSEGLTVAFRKTSQNKKRGYTSQTDFELSKKYFGLTNYESNWLFDPNYYDDTARKAVITRLRKFVKQGVKDDGTYGFIQLCRDFDRELRAHSIDVSRFDREYEDGVY